MQAIVCLSEHLLDSQEQLCFVNLLIGLFIYLVSSLIILMYPNQLIAKTRSGRVAMSDKRYMYDKIRCLYSANIFK